MIVEQCPFLEGNDNQKTQIKEVYFPVYIWQKLSVCKSPKGSKMSKVLVC
jgi:hypothetical protein